MYFSCLSCPLYGGLYVCICPRAGQVVAPWKVPNAEMCAVPWEMYSQLFLVRNAFFVLILHISELYLVDCLLTVYVRGRTSPHQQWGLMVVYVSSKFMFRSNCLLIIFIHDVHDDVLQFRTTEVAPITLGNRREGVHRSQRFAQVAGLTAG